MRQIVIILLVFGLLSCEKQNVSGTEPINETYDTIKPLEYFPAYPGSYWVYNNGDTLKVSDEYEIYIYNSADFDAEPKYDTIVVPKLILNGFYNSLDTFAFVKQYSISKPKNSGYRDPAFKGILSVTEGAEFTIGAVYQGHRWVGKTIKKDTVIEIVNTLYTDVIITIQYDEACTDFGNIPEECATIKEYYAKNIGLIKREIRSFPDTSFVTDFEINYYEIH